MTTVFDERGLRKNGHKWEGGVSHLVTVIKERAQTHDADENIWIQ
jgi:hypothetical protein